jgi:ATP-binding cassette, subfamily F, member 3
MLHIRDLGFRIAGRSLFERASAVVSEGHKVGLVGRNGTGKTTLFRLIVGEQQIDAGSIEVRRGARVGQVAQEAPGGPQSLLQTVLAADTEREALLAEAETVTDPARIAEVHTRLADIGAHAAPGRAAGILAGLGFDEEAQGRACDDFSGGWRMRVALAGALFARPDLLLLDEPTNHLDLEATLWLESYLSRWRGTLLVISHERTLLNRVVDGILHLEGGRLVRYAGGYDRFERTRRETLVVQAKMQARQLEERRRIQAFVDRFRVQANKARQAQSRVKMLARMEPIASVIEERTVTFRFPQPDPMSPPLVALENASVGYGDGPPVLRSLKLRIDMDDRIALIGANGNGKSTLVKLLADRLKPSSGTLRKSGKLRIGYFSQHQADELDLDATPYDHMARLMPLAGPSQVRAHLGTFAFAQEKADVRVSDLSGGEKARLLFALMSIDKPHIMLLDEPTNHLDVDAREALVQALNSYEGAVILVSHDAHLIDLTCDRLWLVDKGMCHPFEGDLDEYARLLLDGRRETRRAERGAAKPGRKEERQRRAAARQETKLLRKAIKDAEKSTEKLTREKEKLVARLAKPEVYEGPSEKLIALQIKLADVNQAMTDTETAWLEAQEALEAAE